MSDVSQAIRPERQDSPRMEEESPYIKTVEEEFGHIKEEQEEYFIRLQNPHIEEQQQPDPLKKEEEDPPYVKMEVVDIPKWTDEPLKGEDGGPSEASRGAELLSGSSSKGFQADNLIARPSESDDFTSHSLFYLYVSQAHRLEHQESACIKGEEEESPYIKEEESVHIKSHSKHFFFLWMRQKSNMLQQKSTLNLVEEVKALRIQNAEKDRPLAQLESRMPELEQHTRINDMIVTSGSSRGHTPRL
ncbi:uncharacterized protein LOC130927952 [Corythoichthys intestinalis]|uniref:uncharacterized protein LOC130927952 n=1 Tax=Corythoichthys intestinalis TaxID=161448 RepID=UPI0025A6763C|nr:uncharacterized protein LOC130927952 [Corythoichthys intestinalis]